MASMHNIARSHMQLKAWMLSKSSAKFIEDYVQKMYKQMPSKLRGGSKKKTAPAPQKVHMAPLKQFFSENVPIAPKIVPSTTNQTDAVNVKQIKSATANMTKTRDSMDSTNKTLDMNMNMSPNKKFLRLPNYKISTTRRFGSSATNIKTNVYRRHDSRHPSDKFSPDALIWRYNTKVNIGKDTARNLLPIRNQQLDKRLGSVSKAQHISSLIYKELMCLDNATLSRIALFNKDRFVPVAAANKSKDSPLHSWNNPPPINQFRDIRLVKDPIGNHKRLISPTIKRLQERKYSRKRNTTHQANHGDRSTDTLKVDSNTNQSDALETHRLNRMKKLGLIKNSPRPSPSPKGVPKTDKSSIQNTCNDLSIQGVVDNKPKQKSKSQSQSQIQSENIHKTDRLKTLKKTSRKGFIPDELKTAKSKWSKTDDPIVSADAPATKKSVGALQQVMDQSKNQKNPATSSQVNRPVTEANMPKVAPTIKYEGTSGKRCIVEQQKGTCKLNEALNSENYVQVNKSNTPRSPLAETVNSTNPRGSRNGHSNYFSTMKY